MRRNCGFLLTLVIVALLLAPLPIRAAATLIDHGIVLMKTSSPTILRGSILEEAFDTGSDPILDAELVFKGLPLVTQPGSPSLAPADTVVEVDATMFSLQDVEARTIRTRVLATHLVTAVPLTVTYGGTNPELWDAKLCVSNVQPPPTDTNAGFMTLVNDCGTAGRFTSVLVLRPRVVFTRQRDGLTKVLDIGSGTATTGLIAHGDWSTFSSTTPPELFTVPAGAVVDPDCDGTFDKTLPASSNLLLGVSRNRCYAGSPSSGFEQISPVVHDRNDVLVLEPATRDDRVLWHEAALPPADRRFSWALGGVGILGLAAVALRSRPRSGKENEPPQA